MSPYDLTRKDRSPCPDLPVLLVVSTTREAEVLQRTLHPSEFHCIGLCGPIMGLRVRAIIVSIGGWQAKMAFLRSDTEIESVNAWLASVRCRLAAGCSDQFYFL